MLTDYATVAGFDTKYKKHSRIPSFRGEIYLHDTNIFGFAANGNAKMGIKATMINPKSEYDQIMQYDTINNPNNEDRTIFRYWRHC